MCMKETSLMLTMLISGSRSPAKNIDVYLQPLIKELQELWKGVWTKDAATGTHFQMKATVLWTINDFPARSSLSGWSGQGYYACPTCNEDTPSMAVKNKIIYVGYRRFLRTQHPLRSKFKELCGFPERKPKPRKFTEMDIQLQIRVRLPDGFGSNFKQKVTADDNNITGLKSHDCHIMIHRLLPYGVQRYLPKHIAAPIIELCLFFKQLCARSLMQQDMAKAKKQFICMMINLEQIFPPDFFDIMIHLVIHLPDEAIQGGPLRYRWMFPFERYMKKLKNYIRNKAKPEGSIVEGYVAEEALTFYKFQVFQFVCKPTGRMKETRMTTDVMQEVVWFVLNNSPEVDADILAYREESPDNVETSFPAWFNYKLMKDNADFIDNEDDVVAHVLDDDDVEVSDDEEVNLNGVCKLHDHTVGMLVVVHPDGPHGPYRPSAKAIFSGMLNSLFWETCRPLPLACEWDEIPEAFKAHIYPTLESYFNLAEWYNNQDKVVVDQNVYTVGERVRLGLELKLRLLWRKNKNRIKADHYAKHTSPDEAKNHPPPPRVWGDRTEDDWNQLLAMKAYARLVKAVSSLFFKIPIKKYWRANRAFGDVMTRDQITQMFRQQEQEKELLRKQAEEAQARAYLAALKADAAEQRANVVQQNSKANNAALGQFFMHYYSPNSARPFIPPTFSHVPSPPPVLCPITPLFAATLLQPPFPFTQPLQPPYTGPLQPPYTGPLQPPYTGPFPPTPVTNNNFNNCYRPVLNSTHCVASGSNSQAERPHYILQTNPHMNDSRSCEQLAQDLARENNNESSGEEEEDEQRTGGDDDYSDDDDYDE
ncbi:reverse transcriptase domain-containing protein [Tanacetum coccineum]